MTTKNTPNRLHPLGAMRSNTGAVRPLNEDRVAFVAPQPSDPTAARGNLMLVADGMGGHAAGEVASEIAVETVRRAFYEVSGEVPQVLAAAFQAANRAILSWAEGNPECKGMGTTCTAIAVRDDEAWLAHVGDSRAYLLRNATITQLSDDQTLVAQMVRDGQLTTEQAHNSPINNVILQALGSHAQVIPAIWSEPLRLVADDVLILCTDGLSGVVADETIAELAGRLPADEACEGLINAALAAGAPDNVSVGVFRMVPQIEQADGEPPAGGAKTTRRVNLAAAESAAKAAQTRKVRVGQPGTQADG